MLSVIKNDWYRMREQRLYLFIAMGLTAFSVLLAVVMTNKLQSGINLAVVGSIPDKIESSRIHVTDLEQEPMLSQLVQGQYDVVLSVGQDSAYHLRSIKSQEYQETLVGLLKGDRNNMGEMNQERQIGTNIIGYMLMFVLMQGMLYARLLAEDKEKHQIERIVCAPISFWTFLSGHVVFTGLLVFIPSLTVIGILSLLRVSLGFALWQYVLVLAVLAFLSTAFGICVNSIFRGMDTANMVGNCLIVLTSVLSGTFYDVADTGDWLSKLLYILPQKNFMVFLEGWEQNFSGSSAGFGLFYVIICAVVFLSIGTFKMKKEYYRK